MKLIYTEARFVFSYKIGPSLNLSVAQCKYSQHWDVPDYIQAQWIIVISIS